MEKKENKENIKKKNKLTVMILSLVIVISLLAVFLYKNSHLLFIAGEYLGVNCKKVKVEKTELITPAAFTLKELEEKENTELNQSLMLVNNEFMLSSDFTADVSEYKDTEVFMSSCMQTAYSELSAAVKEKTDSPLYVSSDFRTREQQEQEYKDNPSVAIKPGASEHQGGLALDVYVKYFAGEGFIKSEAGQFVNSQCHQYGFIIRYPSFGKSKTKIGFEPWHIRYVGQPHADIIYNNHLTLEDYILSFEKGLWYEAEDYIISRQELSAEGTLQLPQNYERAVISPDNTGCYMITVKLN